MPSSRPRSQRRAAAREQNRQGRPGGGAGPGSAHPRRQPPVTGAAPASTIVLRVVTAVLAVGLITAAVLVIRPWDVRPTAAEELAANTPVVADNTHLLNDAGPDAPVLVEFLDFECEACGFFYPTVEDLRERYGDRVTFAARYFPIASHANSTNAAIAAEAAFEQDRFEDMYNRMFDTQTEWAERPDSDPSIFRAMAEELGLDMAAFDASVANPATAERVTFDSDAGRALGVTGTPTFFLDGQRLQLQEPGDIEAALRTALGE